MGPVQGWVATINLLKLNGEDIEVVMDFENILSNATFVTI
jgi:hypothetical protein